MNDLANAHLPPILFRGPDECTRPLVTTKPGGIPPQMPPGWCSSDRGNPLSGFAWVAVVSLDLELADATFGDFDVIAYLAEILCLNELTVRSGMAVEILNLNNLSF